MTGKRREESKKRQSERKREKEREQSKKSPCGCGGRDPVMEGDKFSGKIS